LSDLHPDPHVRRARTGRRISGARKRGLIRLAILVAVVGWLVVLAAKGWLSGGSHGNSAATTASNGAGRTARPRATTSSLRLPEPLHGATAAVIGDRFLLIGGADRADVSTDRVLALDPRTGRASPAGSLTQPLHDAAAASLGGRTLVFGGGASTTYDTVQELSPEGSAHQIGHLPAALSDLSAVSIGGAAYVLGGYDGQQPSASVFRTSDGRSFTRAARLPTAVRYTAVAAISGRIYAFGGELGSGGDTDEIQEFDTATGRASVVGHLPQGVDHAAAIVLNGIIYLVGGRRNGAPSDRILRFDPSRHAVLPAGRLPAPLFDAAAGTASGVGYLAGGIGAQGTSVDSVVTLSENP
jgi:Kelch motif